MASRYKHSHDFDDRDKPSLSINERIVWISDNGPEYGNVRWLGKLHDLGPEWMAGVEFDNPVGSGTGLYRDRQLFETPLNHASLVPVIGLLKASDFDGPSETPRRSPARLIDFHSEPVRKSDPNDFDELCSQIQTRFDNMGINRTNVAPSNARIRNIPIVMERGVTKEKTDVDNFSTNYKRSDLNAHYTSANAKSSNITEDYCHTKKDLKENNLEEPTSNNRQSILVDHRLPRRSDAQRLGGIPMLPPPALIVQPGDENPTLTLRNLLGKSRGIQGHNNSCYLDATLFAMFSSTTLFDSLLYRPPNRDDIPEYTEIQRILREDIVRPLRENYIVSADQVMVFRTLLEQSSSVEGLTDEEKDAEEFMSLLLGQILKAEPYLKLSSGLETFLYQLFVDKDENVILPTVQDLFDQSFVNSTVRLREIPSCLILQMPRSGSQYKAYPRIMQSLTLDITDVLEAVPRSCGHNGKDCDHLARYECKDCLSEQSGRNNARLSSITYCHNCFQSKHFSKSHMTGIEDHDKTKTPLNMTPNEAISRYSNKSSNSKDKVIPRICMDLFAVLCIETSHYVCFVKCGQEPNSPWCFFDSMADRRGEQNGYNIPEVLLFEEFSHWTSEGGISFLLNNKDDKLLPDMARRLICDAYLCFYQYKGLTTYR